MGLDLSGYAGASKGNAARSVTEAFTAKVVRSGDAGLWVVPSGDDPRHPIGPCRGGWTSTGRVPRGTTVLLVMTEDGPWVAAHDNPDL